MIQDEIVKEIAEANGKTGCLIQVMEECAELTKACSKLLRVDGVGNPTDYGYSRALNEITEECADVFVTVSELLYVLRLDNEARFMNQCNRKILRRLSGLYLETGDPHYKEMIKMIQFIKEN